MIDFVKYLEACDRGIGSMFMEPDAFKNEFLVTKPFLKFQVHRYIGNNEKFLLQTRLIGALYEQTEHLRAQ